MTTLSAFTPEDQDILVATPFLVGMWISTIDDDEGEGDDRAERARLKSAIAMLARRHADDVLIAETLGHLHEVIDHREFVQGIDQAMDHAVAAVRTIQAIAGPAEARAYAGALLEVASAVARAASESAGYDNHSEGDEGLLSRITAQAGALWSRVIDGANSERNISPAEDSALTDLSNALKRALNPPRQVG